MRILIGSPAFPPSLGGIERFVEQIAAGLQAAGDEVMVLTATPAPTPDRYPFRVLRRPSARAKLGAFRWADVFFQANVAIKDLWPLLLVRRPWVVSHHGLYDGTGAASVLGRAKVWMARRARSAIAVSQFVAGRLDSESVVIPNPYRDDLFRLLPEVERDRSLLFVGRLVSDKGVDVLLDSMSRLEGRCGDLALTIVGEGPEEPMLRRHVAALGLAGRVTFRGRLDGEDLVAELNRHRILVVPSRWEEPFGIVALEGIACGCVVVGTDRGGLPEAIGPCGRVVPAGDPGALSSVLMELLGKGDLDRFRDAAREHLARHTGARVVDRYREVLLSVTGKAS